MAQKKTNWKIAINLSVSNNWIEDGFDPSTPERVKQIEDLIRGLLPYALPNEVGIKVYVGKAQTAKPEPNSRHSHSGVWLKMWLKCPRGTSLFIGYKKVAQPTLDWLQQNYQNYLLLEVLSESHDGHNHTKKEVLFSMQEAARKVGLEKEIPWK